MRKWYKKISFLLVSLLMVNVMVVNGFIKAEADENNTSEIIVDNTEPGFSMDSPWKPSTFDKSFYGKNYMTDGDAESNSDKWAKWAPNITKAGDYNVYVWWVSGGNRAKEVPLEIKYDGGVDTAKVIDESKNGGAWRLIGTYKLSAGTDNYVKMLASGAGFTIADAVKFEPATEGAKTQEATPTTVAPTPTATPAPTPEPVQVTGPAITTSAAINRLTGSVILFIGSERAFVDRVKTQIDADNPEVKPMVIDGRTLVPLRFISESVGAQVNWDDVTSTISVVSGEQTIQMTLNNNQYYVNGQESTLDVPAQEMNGRTFVPLRALVEALGKKVFWDDRGLIIISDVDNIFKADSEKALIDLVIDLFKK